ncbi:ABC transporter permease [Moritella yayanosii]|uniref:Arginine ABC transporter permease protein ArtM n=1 Tax=Moritella yayanosii TaxID=69539 RepID=A0A330LQF1_9GAMM|nr:ABC transporter permease subunit [Moritella yayanosii]SQD78201.1 histidine/lysine/arginine/ornithine transporter subunit; membrane component of ABC superfamily [Moritella yayanosii]
MLDQLIALLEQNEMFTPSTLNEYWDGTVLTVQLAFLSVVIGFFLAVPLAIMRASQYVWLSRSIWLFTYVFRGTPLLIQLYLIYYGVTMIDGIQDSAIWFLLEDAFYPCLLAFVLNTAAYSTEIIRGSLLTTDKGEIEAAQAYGMSDWQVLRRIILPSAYRRALPAYSNEVIFMLHATSIASVVTLVDITGAGYNVYSRFYAPFEAFLFAGAIYLCLCFAIFAVFKRLEKHAFRHLA